jgi:hypothetical protein
MAQEIYASIRVQLPEDLGLSAVRHVLVAQAWAEMIAKISDLDGVQCSLSISESRTKRASRKPRLVTPATETAA